jgi:hypothetical protein
VVLIQCVPLLRISLELVVILESSFIFKHIEAKYIKCGIA